MKKETLSERPKIEIVNDDCLNYLKTIPDDSIDCVITSPPYYSLRDYQVKEQIGLEPTFEEYINKLLEIFKEIKRVLKKSGSFWLNIGDVYSSRSWSGNEKGQPINKCMMMMPERIAIKMVDELGFILRQKIVWAKQVLINKEKITIGNAMPSSIKTRFNTTWEYLFHFVKNIKGGTGWYILGNTPNENKYPEKYKLWENVPEKFKRGVWKKEDIPQEFLPVFSELDYYFDLDSVRLPLQSSTIERVQKFIINNEESRLGNPLLHKIDPARKAQEPTQILANVANKFNYRVRDAERKEGQPQFKASEEEITSQIARKYGYDPEGICLICGRTWKRHASPNAKDREEGLRREFIPCIKRDWRKETEEGYKMGSVDPHRAALRGGLKYIKSLKESGHPYLKQDNVPSKEKYQGKFLNHPEAEMFGSLRARTQRKTDAIMRGEVGEKIHHGISKKANELGLTSFEYSLLYPNFLGKNIPTVWQINPEPHNFREELGVEVDHFATFPKSLCEIPIKASCPEGGTVLDPFSGSGTVGVVCVKLNRNFIGIDISEKYCQLAKERLKPLLSQRKIYYFY